MAGAAEEKPQGNAPVPSLCSPDGLSSITLLDSISIPVCIRTYQNYGLCCIDEGGLSSILSSQRVLDGLRTMGPDASSNSADVGKPDEKASGTQPSANASTHIVPTTDEFGLPVRTVRSPTCQPDNPEPSTNSDPNGSSNAAENDDDLRSVEEKSTVALERNTATPIVNGTDTAPKDEGSVSKHDAEKNGASTTVPSSKSHGYKTSRSSNRFSEQSQSNTVVSEWSHQQLAPQIVKDDGDSEESDEWQEMPAYAPYDLYNDDGKLVAKEEQVVEDDKAVYNNLGGASRGYTRVQVDDDAQSATSLDDNTAYLFKEPGADVAEEDEEARDPLAQMQATKDLLTEGQRIAYVGLARLAMVQMTKELDALERTKGTKKDLDTAVESMKMWSQKIMVRLYSHMEIDAAGTALESHERIRADKSQSKS